MLHDLGSDRWGGICDRCILALPRLDGTRAEVEARLRELAYEVRPDGQVWCLGCSRIAREVKLRPTVRGVVRRRRR